MWEYGEFVSVVEGGEGVAGYWVVELSMCWSRSRNRNRNRNRRRNGRMWWGGRKEGRKEGGLWMMERGGQRYGQGEGVKREEKNSTSHHITHDLHITHDQTRPARNHFYQFLSRAKENENENEEENEITPSMSKYQRSAREGGTWVMVYRRRLG